MGRNFLGFLIFVFLLSVVDCKNDGRVGKRGSGKVGQESTASESKGKEMNYELDRYGIFAVTPNEYIELWGYQESSFDSSLVGFDGTMPSITPPFEVVLYLSGNCPKEVQVMRVLKFARAGKNYKLHKFYGAVTKDIDISLGPVKGQPRMCRIIPRNPSMFSASGAIYAIQTEEFGKFYLFLLK